MNFSRPQAGAIFAALSNCKNHDNGNGYTPFPTAVGVIFAR
jgi:hypothetical protein